MLEGEEHKLLDSLGRVYNYCENTDCADRDYMRDRSDYLAGGKV